MCLSNIPLEAYISCMQSQFSSFLPWHGLFPALVPMADHAMEQICLTHTDFFPLVIYTLLGLLDPTVGLLLIIWGSSRELPRGRQAMLPLIPLDKSWEAQMNHIVILVPVLFCFVLFCFDLFCFVLFCFVLLFRKPQIVCSGTCTGLHSTVYNGPHILTSLWYFLGYSLGCIPGVKWSLHVPLGWVWSQGLT